MDKLHAYLTEQKPLNWPKGPMSKAIRYILGNWEELTAFLDDVHLPRTTTDPSPPSESWPWAGRTSYT